MNIRKKTNVITKPLPNGRKIVFICLEDMVELTEYGGDDSGMRPDLVAVMTSFIESINHKVILFHWTRRVEPEIEAIHVQSPIPCPVPIPVATVPLASEVAVDVSSTLPLEESLPLSENV
ncbi:hypothetical protein Fot_37576 [Forsythia ovata]|uniref:Uncharacterized protein n=1 Tax=Forsythia ovata TaxID=205694 RepID=A0ABD1RZD1_9LAMI